MKELGHMAGWLALSKCPLTLRPPWWLLETLSPWPKVCSQNIVSSCLFSQRGNHIADCSAGNISEGSVVIQNPLQDWQGTPQLNPCLLSVVETLKVTK